MEKVISSPISGSRYFVKKSYEKHHILYGLDEFKWSDERSTLIGVFLVFFKYKFYLCYSFALNRPLLLTVFPI